MLAGFAATGTGAAGAFGLSRLAGEGNTAKPRALVAGSLLSVSRRIGGAAIEAHGSAGVRRLVVEGLRSPDAVALADPRLFTGISDRATLFATNALVLAYDPASPHADALREDWRSALADGDLAVGRTDPQVDPLGYRTVMALRLAGRRSDLDADGILERSTILPETNLLNVLQGGGVDAAFAYRSMVVERDLPAANLPDAIDFSNPEYADTYASVSYELPHAEIRGAPIRYGATALTARGSPWVESLVSARDVLESNGFVVPPDYPKRDVRLPVDAGASGGG